MTHHKYTPKISIFQIDKSNNDFSVGNFLNHDDLPLSQ